MIFSVSRIVSLLVLRRCLTDNQGSTADAQAPVSHLLALRDAWHNVITGDISSWHMTERKTRNVSSFITHDIMSKHVTSVHDTWHPFMKSWHHVITHDTWHHVMCHQFVTTHLDTVSVSSRSSEDGAGDPGETAGHQAPHAAILAFTRIISWRTWWS